MPALDHTRRCVRRVADSFFRISMNHNFVNKSDYALASAEWDCALFGCGFYGMAPQICKDLPYGASFVETVDAITKSLHANNAIPEDVKQRLSEYGTTAQRNGKL